MLRVKRVVRMIIIILVLAAISDVIIFHGHDIIPRARYLFAHIPEPATALLCGIGLFLVFNIFRRLMAYA
jgi:hypothetical protein